MHKKILTLWFLICIVFFGIFVSAQTVEPRIVRVWSTLEVGTNSMFITNIDVAFTEIFFNTKTKFEAVTFTVERKNYLPASYSFPEKTAYQYLKIDKSGIDNSDMSNMIIKFRVEKSWIDKKTINESSISLLKYVNGWKKQKTETDFEDDVYYHYKSEIDGFSYFAIVGEKKQIVPVVEEPEQVEEEIIPIVIEEEPEGERNISKIILISLLSFIVVIAIAYINLKNKISFSKGNIPELKNYIMQAKSQGEQYTKIKTDLINEGWDEKDIDKALSETKIPTTIKTKMIDYVKMALKKGKDKEDIRMEFINAGWQKEIIDDIFSSLT